jgi:hypothetical protein
MLERSSFVKLGYQTNALWFGVHLRSERCKLPAGPTGRSGPASPAPWESREKTIGPRCRAPRYLSSAPQGRGADTNLRVHIAVASMMVRPLWPATLAVASLFLSNMVSVDEAARPR